MQLHLLKMAEWQYWTAWTPVIVVRWFKWKCKQEHSRSERKTLLNAKNVTFAKHGSFICCLPCLPDNGRMTGNNMPTLYWLPPSLGKKVACNLAHLRVLRLHTTHTHMAQFSVSHTAQCACMCSCILLTAAGPHSATTAERDTVLIFVCCERHFRWVSQLAFQIGLSLFS